MTSGRKIYVGNLPPDVEDKDVEDIFYKFGKIIACDVRSGRGPPFAFVEFDDRRDADDAVRDRDGYDFDGYKLRVEIARDYNNTAGGGGFRGGGFGGRGSFGRDIRGPPRGAPRAGQTPWKVLVTDVPPTGSWQDLKDHFREAGDICFADILKPGEGVIEFRHEDDMKYCLKKFDDTKFKSHQGDVGYVRVEPFRDHGRSHDTYRGSRGASPPPRRSGYRSRSRDGRRSPRYSPYARRSLSRSPLY